LYCDGGRVGRARWVEQRWILKKRKRAEQSKTRGKKN
jgi:hypothetical protein